jgi:hypothetical protein
VEAKPRFDATFSKLLGRVLYVVVGITLVSGVYWLTAGTIISHPTVTQASTIAGAKGSFGGGVSFLLGLFGGKFTP